MKDSSVRWGPSEHRNLRGRADHGLVQCVWSWKVRAVKKKVVKDYSVLSRAATQKVVQIRQQFNDTIASKTKGKQQLISPWTTNIIRCDKQSPLHVTYFSRTRQTETFSRAKCLNGQKDFLTNESGEAGRRRKSTPPQR